MYKFIKINHFSVNDSEASVVGENFGNNKLLVPLSKAIWVDFKCIYVTSFTTGPGQVYIQP